MEGVGGTAPRTKTGETPQTLVTQKGSLELTLEQSGVIPMLNHCIEPGPLGKWNTNAYMTISDVHQKPTTKSSCGPSNLLCPFWSRFNSSIPVLLRHTHLGAKGAHTSCWPQRL